MSRIQTLLARLTAKPTPADFTFSELCKVMAYFGYRLSNKGATSGSRVKFYNKETGTSFTMHRPHPRDKIKKGSLDAVIKFLKECDHI